MRSRATLVLAALLLAACGGGGEPGGSSTPVPVRPQSSSAATPDDATLQLLVLSDSSGYGVAERWARLAEERLGVPVEATDLAIGSYSGQQMLTDLRTEGSEEREAARDADLVMVWVSPMGVEGVDDSCILDDSGRELPAPATRASFAGYAALWRDVLDEILALRDGQPTALRVRDLYSPVLAQWTRAGKAAECTAGLRMMSATARRAAAAVGAQFVSLYAAINGPDRMRDAVEAGFVSADGAHLSARGRALQARLLDSVGYAELR